MVHKINKKSKDILLIVDYGKPYEQRVNSMSELKHELRKLKRMADNEEVAYMDVDVEIDGVRLDQDDFDKILKI